MLACNTAFETLGAIAFLAIGFVVVLAACGVVVELVQSMCPAASPRRRKSRRRS